MPSVVEIRLRPVDGPFDDPLTRWARRRSNSDGHAGSSGAPASRQRASSGGSGGSGGSSEEAGKVTESDNAQRAKGHEARETESAKARTSEGGAELKAACVEGVDGDGLSLSIRGDEDKADTGDGSSSSGPGAEVQADSDGSSLSERGDEVQEDTGSELDAASAAVGRGGDAESAATVAASGGDVAGQGKQLDVVAGQGEELDVAGQGAAVSGAVAVGGDAQLRAEPRGVQLDATEEQQGGCGACSDIVGGGSGGAGLALHDNVPNTLPPLQDT